jgi:hypothetical protein
MKRLCLALLFAFILAGPASAHEGHDDRVLGTVAAVEPQSIAIKTQEGKTVRIALDDRTAVYRGDQKVDRTDIIVGERAAVSVGAKRSTHVATQIRLGPKK